MQTEQSERLADDKMVRCLQCGDAVWDYPTPSGKRVALDDLAGRYVIRGDTAFESVEGRGYAGHWDHCKLATFAFCGRVDSDEFLWR